MYPILFQWGPVTIHTYGVLLATGFVVGLWVAARQARREGIVPDRIVDLAFYILLAALIGSRLLYVAVNWSWFAARPLDILKMWEGGLVFYGGLLLAVPVGIWYVRRKGLHVWQVADLLAPSIALAHGIGRLGCFSAGCCYGIETDLPWGVVFSDPHSLAPLGAPIHPTQIYESAGELLIFAGLLFYRNKKTAHGQVFAAYLFAYGILRFGVEFVRGDADRGLLPGLPISLSQVISLLLVAGAAVALLRLRGKEIGSKQ